MAKLRRVGRSCAGIDVLNRRRQSRWRWIALLVAGVIAALPVLHCTVMADIALPVVSHHSAAAVSGPAEDVGQRMGRAVVDFSGQIFDVIAGKIRSGGAFRMLWAAALIVPLFLSLHLVRVVAPRAPPRRLVSLAAGSGRGRLQQICVSRR
ncbi:hypothetical protein [Mycobacteroides salmoniphilum]|uniref:hypothetical protein n=1 Tax=Mycobacteroides salmoniphilum TaxID=404941 RepID=UPI001064B0F5|nr:hypothetical protein [Mycobacteroides salmoniphilum]